ncbi:MAG: hypothetical protein EHM58_17470 [Ignavibacteriae bacterium]|nr:MAG: hypothetical protein EHM58_17470 [Ignavibacteriota bacterium]
MKIIKSLITLIILAAVFSSCETIWQSSGEDDPVDGYFWDVEPDSVNAPGYRFAELYNLTLNILCKDSVIYTKTIKSDTAYISVDSMKLDTQKEYSIGYYCKWQGARLDYALKMSVANLSYFIGFYDNEVGKFVYKEKLRINQPVTYIKFGVCTFSQDIK